MLQMLEVSDVSGQKRMTVDDISEGSRIGELVEQFLADLDLVKEDAEGRPLNYHARLEREGRHLNGAERAGDALQSGDLLVLQPNIDAGRGA
jgi:hypothetical protein